MSSERDPDPEALQERIDELEAQVDEQQDTLQRMLPGRRAVLAGAAGLTVGAVGMQQFSNVTEASDGTAVGQIGTSSEKVNVVAHDVTSDSVDTEDIQSRRGVFGIRHGSDFVGEGDGTGGAAIQAAINDLPARGGMVFVPAEGPDTATNSDGVSESNVWEVTSEITSGGKSSVWVVGAAPGWSNNESGTALICSDGTVGAMLTLDGGFLDGVSRIRFDAAGNATNCIDLGGGSTNNDWQASQVMAQDATGDGIVLTGDKNFWLRSCWSERHGGAGVGFDLAGGHSVWMDDHLSFANQNAIAVRSQTDKVWIRGLRSEDETGHGIYINATFGDPTINAHIDSPGNNCIEIAGSMSNAYIQNPVLYAGGDNAINMDTANGGEVTDCWFGGVRSGNAVVNVRDSETSAATRTLLNGLGYNDGDPSSSGTWGPKSNPLEGIRVWDYTNNVFYRYADGAWR